MQSAMFHTIVRLATMPEKISSRNVSPDGQNSSPRMKFNSQTTPLTTFLAFVDHMSCSADTYVSLGGSNVCADQLTNWDGTQKVGVRSTIKKEAKRLIQITTI